MRENLQTAARMLSTSAGARQGMVMAGATTVAGGFDYLVNVVIGRSLLPTQFIVFVAVTALLQIMVHATNVIRNVVAFYMAELSIQPEALARSGIFLRRSWRWAWRWGVVAMAAMALFSPLLARLLRIDTPWPLWAGSLALLLLFLRPITDGALQGNQHFAGLGAVQVLQAFLRLLLAPLLIWFGWQATGAILSLPLASAGALLLALWLLRRPFRAPDADVAVPPVSWHYSITTLVGLLAFALLINLDAMVVKRVFSPEIAGNYGPVVTLGKMNLFVPLGIGLVLFPKATQRQAAGRDSRPVLLLALVATLLPGLLLTLVYFWLPGLLVQTIFTDAYADPGIVLGLVGLATTLFAGVNIWLNYALSLGKRPYIYALAATVTLQFLALALFHQSLVAVAAVMVAAGFLGNVAGLVTTLRQGAAAVP